MLLSPKVKTMQDAGAVGVIILNYDDDIIHMILPEDQHDDIVIPSVLITKSDSDFVRGHILAQKQQGNSWHDGNVEGFLPPRNVLSNLEAK